jgi:hypothetical protein
VGTFYVIGDLEDHRDTQRKREYSARWRGGYEKRIWVRIAKRVGNSDVDPRFATDPDNISQIASEDATVIMGAEDAVLTRAVQQSRIVPARVSTIQFKQQRMIQFDSQQKI